jgi:hypothetical protein
VTNPICFTLDLFRVFASSPSLAPSRLISIAVSVPHPWLGFVWIAQQQHGNYVIARRSIQFISTAKNNGEHFIHGDFDVFKFFSDGCTCASCLPDRHSLNAYPTVAIYVRLTSMPVDAEHLQISFLKKDQNPCYNVYQKMGIVTF